MSSPGALVFSSIPGSRPGAERVQAHVRSLRRSGLHHVAVVQAPDEIRPNPGVQIVMQPAAWNDPFDALVLGVFALNRDAVLVVPAENDVVSDATMVQLLSEAMHPGDSFALAPMYRQRRGYPLMLFRKGIEAVVREAASPSGVKFLESLLARWGSGVRTLAVPDDAVTYRFAALA